jgi:CubicO group peptidase (beta-lactamase class C family)
MLPVSVSETKTLEELGRGLHPRMEAPPDAVRLSRRTFLRHATVATGAAALAPFSFVRSARAAGLDLERFVREQMREAITPGIAVAIVRGGEVTWSFGAGWADIENGVRATTDTVFMLASVSKTVTCAGVMTLVEEGLLDLDADVNDYLPFEVRVPAAPNAAITTRMLLTHTSAVRDRWGVWGRPNSDPTLYFHGDSPIALGDFLGSYLVPGGSEYREDANFYERRPGTQYAYCNIAVALAGYVAEVVAGQDFDELCKGRILAPLGMTQSGFRLADITTSNLAMPYRLDEEKRAFDPFFQYGYPDYPDGALRTSAAHLARWLAAFMRFGELDGVRVLERGTVHEIRRNQIPDIAWWHQGLVWYGASPNGFFRMGHTGGDFGVSTRMFFRPDTQVGVVSLTNSALGGPRWNAFRAIDLRIFDEYS